MISKQEKNNCLAHSPTSFWTIFRVVEAEGVFTIDWIVRYPPLQLIVIVQSEGFGSCKFDQHARSTRHAFTNYELSPSLCHMYLYKPRD